MAKDILNISPQEFEEKRKKGDAMIILDVRETGEYRVGHIEGSLNIPLGQVLQRTGELDPNKDIVVVCRSGNRSALACEWLASRGFRVFNLDGGLTQWKHIQS